VDTELVKVSAVIVPPSAEFKTKYPDWPNTTVTNFVKSIYAE
jgi:hypothetical protein